jgi:hypothetical protein
MGFWATKIVSETDMASEEAHLEASMVNVDACHCALQISKGIGQLSQTWEQEGKPILKMRIGLVYVWDLDIYKYELNGINRYRIWIRVAG